MPRKKFSESQILLVLREVENGAKIEQVCRKLGVSEATVYNWKKRYSGMTTPEVRRLCQLEEENRKLKSLVADLSLDKVMLQEQFGTSIRRACRLFNLKGFSSISAAAYQRYSELSSSFWLFKNSYPATARRSYGE